MSDQRSWDSRQDCTADYMPENAGKCKPDFTGKPVRIMEWREEWPQQSEVLYAGGRVQAADRFGSASPRWEEVTIETTPVTGNNGKVYIGVSRDDAIGVPFFVDVLDIRPIPPKPETATGEVVGTVEACGNVLTWRPTELQNGTYKVIRVGEPAS